MHIAADLYPWVTVAALAWGLLDCFFGYRIFKYTILVLGAAGGALAGQTAGLALEWGTGARIAGVVAGALLGGGLLYLLYLAAVFLAGFAFGATLGMLLLAHYDRMVALLTGLVLGLIGGYAALKLQKIVLILSTALLGAFRFCIALLYFTQKIDWLFYLRQPRQIPALIDSQAWLLPAVVLLAALGAATQFGLGTATPASGKSSPEAKG